MLIKDVVNMDGNDKFLNITYLHQAKLTQTSFVFTFAHGEFATELSLI